MKELDLLYEEFEAEYLRDAPPKPESIFPELDKKEQEIRSLYGKLAFQTGYGAGYETAMKHATKILKD